MSLENYWSNKNSMSARESFYKILNHWFIFSVPFSYTRQVRKNSGRFGDRQFGDRRFGDNMAADVLETTLAETSSKSLKTKRNYGEHE